MKNNIEGFVVYNKSDRKNKAFAVVSDSYECKAKSENIPSKFKKYIVPIEDKRFYEHNGIDIRGISRAMIRNFLNLKILEGGSTISQQLARNILRENSKTIERKVRETLKALKLEKSYSKNEILHLYFENVYFGKNLRGVRSASLHYFDKEPHSLTQKEILFLLTILRGPNYYINNIEIAKKRMLLLSKLLYENRSINNSQFNKLNSDSVKFSENKIIPLKAATIPYITETINYPKKTINSSIIPKAQNLANEFVKSSKYPISIVIIKEKKVIGFSSSYGADYPFIFKSNVGSTLKPFIYYFARKRGIPIDETFDSYKNNLNWNVREASLTKSIINLNEALFISNNNSFINIVEKIGLNETLSFLSNLLNIPLNELFPSSILGATKNGISLYELAINYNNFLNFNLDENKSELKVILNKIFREKIKINIDNAFLKTGTTNNDDERIAIINHAKTTYAILRNENPQNDSSKEGNFLDHIKKLFLPIFNSKNDYKWI